MKKAIGFELSKIDKNSKFGSVYMGGGTPSVLPEYALEEIFGLISPFTDCNTEITVEMNPKSTSKSKAETLKKAGVNRISLGLQSLHNQKLTFLGRGHTAKEGIQSVETLRVAGFSNISADFMYDTEFDDLEFLKKELDGFLALNTEHISSYSLTIEEGTPFFEKKIETRYDDKAARYVSDRLISGGFLHYEVAAFGKIKSLHNRGYWEYKPYIGIGAGAVGFDGEKRVYPHKEIEEYIKNPTEYEYESVTADEQKTERIFLGLRSDVGVDISMVSKKQKEIDYLLEAKIIEIKNGKIYSLDFFLADEAAVRLS